MPAISMRKPEKPRPIAATVNDDGSITIGSKRIMVPGICLEKVIGSGANGIVARGHHLLLSVQVAVKFWIVLRRHDSRDKMAQGIAEVRKMFRTEHYRSVVLVRDAGQVDGVFYSVMDLFPGETLHAWLRRSPSLGLRRLVARRLIDEVCALSHLKIYHGDLHTRNILVDTRSDSLLEGREPRFGIIDFGTSVFGPQGASRARHWRVFTETLDRLLRPFEVHVFARTGFPGTATPRLIRPWYQTSLAVIRHVLIRLGADWLIDPEEKHEFYKREWTSRDAMLADVFPVPLRALEAGRALIQKGDVIMTRQWLGDGMLWLPPRHVMIDELDDEQFGWSTSRTDTAWWRKVKPSRK